MSALRWSASGDGGGRTLLLVHAGVADSRMWEPLVAELGDEWRVVRCDLRGFGATTLKPGPFSHAGDVAALVEELALAPLAVVGASMGGAVALELAVTRPELVRGLVLLAASVADHDWSTEVQAFGQAEDAALAAGDLDGAVELNLRMWVDGPRRGPDEVDAGVRGLVAAMQRRAFELQLGVDAEDEEGATVAPGDVRCPTLVLDGELDVDDFAAIARRLVREIPGARRATVAGAAHLVALERPVEVARLLGAFLRDLD